ncbi:hypothetical protein PLUA15_310066 [Pseudomonas lundensis]|uniref:Uncharacterized protein n=1 Tax=Pseudomonas lundensis TaxID=86185 RepID=A0AAX2H8U2_9PSED|nr:hypothetical protein PLUA15_310066 [Pseudomonas lundensis]
MRRGACLCKKPSNFGKWPPASEKTLVSGANTLSRQERDGVRGTLSGGPEAPAQHIEQIAAIAQQQHGGGGQVLEVDLIGVFQVTARKGFHQLRDRQHTGCGVGVQDVQRGVTVNQQGGDGAIDGSQRDVGSVRHGRGPFVFSNKPPFFVAKRN